MKKGEEKALILFVGGKSEAREAITNAGQALSMPYVAGRWIGGTLTNFSEIKKRIARLEELTTQREKGELGKYTKKERLLIDRDIEKLTIYFGGISIMKFLPKVMVIIDPKKESIAVAEAKKMKIPVVAEADDGDSQKGRPGHTRSNATVASFRTWRGSRPRVALTRRC